MIGMVTNFVGNKCWLPNEDEVNIILRFQVELSHAKVANDDL